MKIRSPIWIAASLLVAPALFGVTGCSRLCGKKFAVILQADTDRHEGMARAVHALLYSLEMKRAGYPVVLIFDGAGTGWAEKLRDPKHPLHARYEEVKKAGVTEVVCDFCSGAFGVKDSLKKENAPFAAEFEGHPSILKWVKQGYKVIVL